MSLPRALTIPDGSSREKEGNDGIKRREVSYNKFKMPPSRAVWIRLSLMPPSPPCWWQKRRWLQLPVAISSVSRAWGQNYVSWPPLHFSLSPHIHLTVPLLPKLKTWFWFAFPALTAYSKSSDGLLLLCMASTGHTSYLGSNTEGFSVIQCKAPQERYVTRLWVPWHWWSGEKASLEGTQGTKPIWLWKVLAHH